MRWLAASSTSGPGLSAQMSRLFCVNFKEHLHNAVNLAKNYINRIKMNLCINFSTKLANATSVLG